MLRVIIQLVPYGHEKFKKTIGEMIIANDLGGTLQFGNYVAMQDSDDWTNTPQRTTTIKRFDRSGSAWDLLRKVLNKLHKGQTAALENKYAKGMPSKMIGNSDNVMMARLANELRKARNLLIGHSAEEALQDIDETLEDYYNENPNK